MNILVDAHIGKLIIGFLEARGHEVSRAASFPPGTSDEEILRRSCSDGRAIMTSDKDFGELVFRHGLEAIGVVLLRIDVPSEAERLAGIERFWTRIEPVIVGHFVTVTARSVRKTPLPRGKDHGASDVG